MKLPRPSMEQTFERYNQAVVVMQGVLHVMIPVGNPQDLYQDLLTGTRYPDDLDYKWIIRPGDVCEVDNIGHFVRAIFRGYSGDIFNPFKYTSLTDGKLHTSKDIRPVESRYQPYEIKRIYNKLLQAKKAVEIAQREFDNI